MSFETIIATVTFTLSILTKIVGLPSQAKKIHQTKDSSSQSLILYVLIFLSYLSWTIHGLLKKDNTIIFGQGLGILTSGVILVLIIVYRKKKHSS